MKRYALVGFQEAEAHLELLQAALSNGVPAAVHALDGAGPDGVSGAVREAARKLVDVIEGKPVGTGSTLLIPFGLPEAARKLALRCEVAGVQVIECDPLDSSRDLAATKTWADTGHYPVQAPPAPAPDPFDFLNDAFEEAESLLIDSRGSTQSADDDLLLTASTSRTTPPATFAPLLPLTSLQDDEPLLQPHVPVLAGDPAPHREIPEETAAPMSRAARRRAAAAAAAAELLDEPPQPSMGAQSVPGPASPAPLRVPEASADLLEEMPVPGSFRQGDLTPPAPELFTAQPPAPPSVLTPSTPLFAAPEPSSLAAVDLVHGQHEVADADPPMPLRRPAPSWGPAPALGVPIGGDQPQVLEGEPVLPATSPVFAPSPAVPNGLLGEGLLEEPEVPALKAPTLPPFPGFAAPQEIAPEPARPTAPFAGLPSVPVPSPTPASTFSPAPLQVPQEAEQFEFASVPQGLRAPEPLMPEPLALATESPLAPSFAAPEPVFAPLAEPALPYRPSLTPLQSPQDPVAEEEDEERFVSAPAPVARAPLAAPQGQQVHPLSEPIAPFVARLDPNRQAAQSLAAELVHYGGMRTTSARKGKGVLFWFLGSHGGSGKTTCAFLSGSATALAMRQAGVEKEKPVFLIEADYSNSKLANRLRLPRGQDSGRFAAHLATISSAHTNMAGSANQIEQNEEMIRECIHVMPDTGLHVVACPYDLTSRQGQYIKVAINQIVEYAERQGGYVFVDAQTMTKDDPLDLALVSRANHVVLVGDSDVDHLDDARRAAHALTTPAAASGVGVDISRITLFFNKTSHEQFEAVKSQTAPYSAKGFMPPVAQIDPGSSGLNRSAWVGNLEGALKGKMATQMIRFLVEIDPIPEMLPLVQQRMSNGASPASPGAMRGRFWRRRR